MAPSLIARSKGETHHQITRKGRRKVRELAIPFQTGKAIAPFNTNGEQVRSKSNVENEGTAGRTKRKRVGGLSKKK